MNVPTSPRVPADPGAMASGDLEYLEEVFLKVRRTKQWTKSFTVIRDAGHYRAVSENSNNVVVGTNSSVSEPPGT